MDSQKKNRFSAKEKSGIHKKKELPFHFAQDTSLLAHFSCTVGNSNVFDYDPAYMCVLFVQDYARCVNNYYDKKTLIDFICVTYMLRCIGPGRRAWVVNYPRGANVSARQI